MATPRREPTIRVDFDGHRGWVVGVGDTRITCDTLGAARRIAFLQAARRRPCDLVVRDAYFRVIEREHIDAAAGGPAHS